MRKNREIQPQIKNPKEFTLLIRYHGVIIWDQKGRDMTGNDRIWGYMSDNVRDTG